MRRQAAILLSSAVVSLAAVLLPSTVAARPQAQPQPRPVAPPSQSAAGQPPAGQAPKPGAAAPAEVPSAESLIGAQSCRGMQFIESYDAGAGQRYFLFGTTAGFDEVVDFYKSVLKQRGELVFEKPVATHQFDIGKFREETMVFPPSLTVKDYTSNASQGYPNPRPGVEPASYRTVIQIVPIPPETPPVKR